MWWIIAVSLKSLLVSLGRLTTLETILDTKITISLMRSASIVIKPNRSVDDVTGFRSLRGVRQM